MTPTQHTTSATEPEALRLANILAQKIPSIQYLLRAAAELRRQHNRIEALQAELEAVGAGGVQALAASAPVALQQGEYLLLPQPDTHCYDEDTGMDVWSYSASRVLAYVDADRASRGAAQAAPVTVAEDAEDGARFRAMVNAALNEDAFEQAMYAAANTEPKTLDDFRALVDKARAAMADKGAT